MFKKKLAMTQVDLRLLLQEDDGERVGYQCMRWPNMLGFPIKRSFYCKVVTFKISENNNVTEGGHFQKQANKNDL